MISIPIWTFVFLIVLALPMTVIAVLALMAMIACIIEELTYKDDSAREFTKDTDYKIK